jgi:hypothetical protein
VEKVLRDYFLDYVNNHVSVEGFAKLNGIDTADALKLISMGRDYNERLSRVVNQVDTYRTSVMG